MERGLWVAQLIAGEAEAWVRFTREFHPLIRTVASRVGLRGEDREDVVQKVCFIAVRHIHALRDPEKLASWVYGVARRVSIDHRRGAPRELVVEDLEALADASLDGRTEPEVEARLARARRAAELQDALSLLDPRCQRLLRSLYLDDPPATYDQISEREAMPVGSIGPTRGRCMEKLTRLFLEVSPEPPAPTRSERRRGGTRPGTGPSPDAPHEES